MGAVHPSNGHSNPAMTCLENFKSNPKAISRYLPNIIS